MKKNDLITILIVALIAIIIGGAVGYFFGSKSQTIRRSMFGQTGFRNQQGQGPSNNQQGGQNGQINRMGGGLTNGEIISKDDKSITVKMNDGSSRIVMIADNTTISKSSSAVKDDLKVGEKVAVFGAINDDGSMTANNIQLNPQTKAPPQQ